MTAAVDQNKDQSTVLLAWFLVTDLFVFHSKVGRVYLDQSWNSLMIIFQVL